MFRYVVPSSHNIRVCWQGRSVSSVLSKLNTKLAVCFLNVPPPIFWGELLIWVHKYYVGPDFYKTSTQCLHAVSLSHTCPLLKNRNEPLESQSENWKHAGVCHQLEKNPIITLLLQHPPYLCLQLKCIKFNYTVLQLQDRFNIFGYEKLQKTPLLR